MRRPSLQDNPRSGRMRLALYAAIAAAAWLIVLPAVGRLAGPRERIAFLRRKGIDPSAKFYTEHPALERWLRSVRSDVRRSVRPD